MLTTALTEESQDEGDSDSESETDEERDEPESVQDSSYNGSSSELPRTSFLNEANSTNIQNAIKVQQEEDGPRMTPFAENSVTVIHEQIGPNPSATQMTDCDVAHQQSPDIAVAYSQ